MESSAQQSEQYEYQNDFRGRGRGRGRRGGRGGRGERGEGGFDRPRNFERRPYIRLERRIEDIVLSDEQKAKIKELDDELQALPKLDHLTHEATERRSNSIKNEIDELGREIEGLRAKLDNLKREQNEFLRRNGLGEDTVTGRDINAKREQLRVVESDLDKVKKDREKYAADFRSKQQRAGARSVEEAQARIDKLNDDIESSSLSKKELKSMLAEIDRLQGGIKLLNEGGLQKKLNEAKDREQELFTQRRTLKNELTELVRKRDELNEARKVLEDKLRPFEERRKAVEADMKQKQLEQKSKREEQEQVWINFRQNRDKVYDNEQKQKDIEYRKRQIYAEAEKVMKQVEEGRKRISAVQKAEVPHAKEIQTAQTLIDYLLKIVGPEQTTPESSEPVPQRGPAALKMKKQAKKQKQDRRNRGKQKVSHEMDVVVLFSSLHISPPNTVERCQACVEELRKLMAEWKSAFAGVKVNMAIQDDGKVQVSILLR